MSTLGRVLRPFRSVRARITLASTALVAITLVLASLVLVRLVRDDLLASAQETLDLALEAQAEQLGVQQLSDFDGSLDLVSANVDGSQIEIGLFDAGEDGSIFGELYIDGEAAAVVVLDRRTGDIQEIFDPFFEEPLTDPEIWEEVESLVFDVFELTESGEGQVLVGAAPLDDIEQSVAAIGDALTVVVPALAVVFGLSTWLLVGRALRPVMSITDQVEVITTTSLDQRVPVPRTGDEVADLAMVMNDMLDRLQRGGERQRQFSADASHELRSPLSAVRAAAEILMRRPDGPRVEQLADDIMAESDRMNALIGDLLELSRLEEDRRSDTLEPLDLAELIRDEITERDVQIVAPPTLTVQGAPGQLRRLIRNLVDNARRHADGRVVMTLEAPPVQSVGTSAVDGVGGGSVRLLVDDDGHGVPTESRATIFERFARLDDARAREGGGAGLGLALVKAIVDHHRGTISVEDSPLGGARFTVTL